MGDIANKIDHVVVLMLENRSFDSILGALYPDNPGYNGLSGDESNPHSGSGDVQVWTTDATGPHAMSIPDPDPGELWSDINMQLFGLGRNAGDQIPSMDGFVDNYVRQHAKPAADYQAKAIMHYYNPEQVPVISQLARQFAVSDQWFASAPCQTWPNRFFLHCGTANGYQNNSPTHFPYMMETVFNRMEDAGQPWKIYFHDFPQTLTLSRLWPHLEHFRLFDEFLEDARNGTLPGYSFIEPRYFPDLEHLPNDQHPPHNVGMGEELIADVYNAVRSSPAWKRTLLAIIYDEHGGCFDHTPPPLAVPPDDSNHQPFNFDRYGVRIPAVLVSPYIKAGTILRATPDGDLPHDGPPHPYDHTSVIATLRKRFDLGDPLTRRDAAAPDLDDLLNLETPDNDGPAKVVPLDYPMTESDIQKALEEPLNDFQRALHEAASHLPALNALRKDEDAIEKIGEHVEAHVQKILDGLLEAAPDNRTPAEALPFIKSKLREYLGDL